MKKGSSKLALLTIAALLKASFPHKASCPTLNTLFENDLIKEKKIEQYDTINVKNQNNYNDSCKKDYYY